MLAINNNDYLQRYAQGQWAPVIVQQTLEQALADQCPGTWINYLDICHSIQGLTLEQWLGVAQHHIGMSCCSPKLFLRLSYLIQHPGIFDSVSASSRHEYSSTLEQINKYPFSGLISDTLTSGYLGCRVSHYPGLLVDGEIAPYLSPLHSFLCKTDKLKAQTLASKIIPLKKMFEKIWATPDNTHHDSKPCRIAVVGNSPRVMDEEQGEEIDSADVVIRFNNVTIDQEKRKHCGSRTDLWVMSPSTPVNHCPNDAQAIIVSGLHALTRPSFYWKTLSASNKPLSEFPSSVWYDLVKQFQAPPSAGALLLASLETLGNSVDVRYYGFTICQSDVNLMANHHADRTPRSGRHNWQAETDWLADHFAQRKALTITR